MSIVFVIIILLLPIPLYAGFMSLFADRHRQKIQTKLKDGFKRLITRHRLSIGEVNIFGNNLISMDRKMNKMVLVVYKNGITWEKCIDLQEILSCQVVKIINRINSSIQRVNLDVIFHKEETISFSFFDEDADDRHDLPSRIKKADYWKRKIRSRIGNVQLTNAAAI